MLITRLAKIVMCLVLAVFCLLIAYDNITDYNTNYEFVQHVLSMDTTFPGNELMYSLHHQSNPLADRLRADHHRRGLTGVLFLAGVMQMRRALHASGAEFNRAKTYAIAGALLAFLVWFFGFMVVAGEWFAMWQSKTGTARTRPSASTYRCSRC